MVLLSPLFFGLGEEGCGGEGGGFLEKKKSEIRLQCHALFRSQLCFVTFVAMYSFSFAAHLHHYWDLVHGRANPPSRAALIIGQRFHLYKKTMMMGIQKPINPKYIESRPPPQRTESRGVCLRRFPDRVHHRLRLVRHLPVSQNRSGLGPSPRR